MTALRDPVRVIGALAVPDAEASNCCPEYEPSARAMVWPGLADASAELS
jgi:hypothetical protein